MPKRYSFAEERVKAIARSRIKRGKAEVSIIVENLTEEDMTVKLNSAVAGQYINNLRELQSMYDIDGKIDIALIASLPDVMKAVPDVDDEESVCTAVEKAVAAEDERRACQGYSEEDRRAGADGGERLYGETICTHKRACGGFGGSA